MLKKILIALTILSINSTYAYVDLGVQYTFSKRKYDGSEATDINPDPGEATATVEGYTVNWAWYMWEHTALELNYSKTNQRLLDTRKSTDSDTGITIEQVDSIVTSEVQGAGLRQAFAGRKSRIIPSISIGYAQLTTSGQTKYRLSTTTTTVDISYEKDKEVTSSSYASCELRFNFTKLMGLTLSAKTVMESFDASEADKNVTYSAGLSWIF